MPPVNTTRESLASLIEGIIAQHDTLHEPSAYTVVRESPRAPWGRPVYPSDQTESVTSQTAGITATPMASDETGNTIEDTNGKGEEMNFDIRDIRTHEVICGPYTTRSSASRSFKSRGLIPENAYIADLNWKDRERGRANLINIEQFGLVAIPDHFLHISMKSGDTELLVSYTENENKGRRDLQKSGTRVGKYLKEFYPNLSSTELAAKAAEITSRYLDLGVRFAVTRAEVRWVYLNSSDNQATNSCMTHGAKNYRMPNPEGEYYHPVEAYGDSDIQIAYMVDEKSKRVSARTVVWPEKKLYGRLYGSQSSKLMNVLISMGYNEGRMTGAKLNTIPVEYLNKSDNYRRAFYLAPFTDHERYVHLTADNKLVMGPAVDIADITAETSTHGYVAFDVVKCVVSGRRLGRGERMDVYDPSSGARMHIDVRFRTSEYCVHDRDYSGYWFVHKGRESEYGEYEGRQLPLYTLNQYFKKCLVTGKWFSGTQVVSVENGYVSLEAYMIHYATCDMNRRAYPRSEMVWMEHQVWWNKNYFSRNGVTVDGKNYARILLEKKVA